MDEQRAATHNRNIVVVGGVAGGMSFAARARRLDESAHIVVLERDPYVSFANCGLPYHLAGEITEREDLLLHTPESLQQSLNLDVRTCHEVVSIDRAAKEVVVRDRNAVADPGDRDDTAAIYRLPYDHLVLSTGASAIVPDIVGIDRPEVRTLRSVPDLDRLLQLVGMGARSAVVLGAGFIGLEVTEALRHRGLDVHVVELADQVLGPIDPEMARAVQRELEAHAVGIHLGVSATSIDAARSDEQGTAAVMLSDGTRLAADVVLVSIGVRPASGLAAAAGLELGDRGAVRVDASLLTSDPNISAVGDAIEVVDAVTGRPAPVPLAGLANRQGRQAADRLLGTTRTRKAVLGTAIVRVFDLVAATTGATEKALVRAGIDFRKVYLHPNQHAGYFPGAKSLHLKVLFAPDGKVLGAQATGSDGVDKRIDVLATAVRAGLTVDDLAELEDRK
ncbi:MAG: FAD-dependent oxidoreductase, partial [Acidimicrobiia bacterium]